jgi:hypothetical protein
MGKKWTEEELEIIRKNKGKMGNPQLAKLIGCKDHQVIYAMRKYNIKRTKKEVDAIWEEAERIHRYYNPKR